MQDLPQEFLLRMERMLGEEYPSFLASYEKERSYGLRLNTLKCADVSAIKEYNLRSVEWCKDGYYYVADERPGKSVLHEGGAFYIQEPSAMSVVESMDIRKGDAVLDLCAAPGGKSSQIACKLDGAGILISNEIVQSRAKILSQNIERMGVRNCVVLNESPDRLSSRFEGMFDRILVDAPCSGEGMFRKNPLAVGEWSAQNVEACKKRQLSILVEAAKMLKSDGIIAYSTCTFSMQENEEVVGEFLADNPDFEVQESSFKFSRGYAIGDDVLNFQLAKTNRIFPHKVEGEGHFFAILKRRGQPQSRKYACQERKADPKAVKEYRIWQEENLKVSFDADLSFGQILYAMPAATPRLDGLKVERAGLQLGEYKKNRFLPSHSLAMSLRPCEAKRCIELDEDAAYKYLSGYTFDCDVKGWALVAYRGVSLGWCKGDGACAKNHYPKGLRLL